MAGLAQSNGRLPILRSKATSIETPSDEFFDSCRKIFKLFEENEKRRTDIMKYIIDSGMVGSIEVSVLKDEETGEVSVSMTSLTNENTIATLNLCQTELLASILFEIFDKYDK